MKQYHYRNFLVGESVYIVGHNKPDLDSIASAFAYQQYRHAKGDFNYLGIRGDEVNPVTEWVFSHFKQEIPMIVKSVEGKKLVLVDHTDPEQRPNGWQNAEIIEVLDHHRLNLETASPPKITIRPYGSTCTLIAHKFVSNQIEVQPEIAGIILSAILDDTLALRSPTTTYVDKIMAGEMAARSGIGDLASFTRKIFNKKDVWNKLSASKIITTDIKETQVNNIRVIVSQVETMDNRELEKREDEFIAYLSKMNDTDKADLRLVMLTDLLSNNCILLGVGSKMKDLENIFSSKLISKQKLYLPGVLSRKKQVIPPIVEYYSTM